MGRGQLYCVSRPQWFTYFKTYSWAVDDVDFIDEQTEVQKTLA